MATDTFAGPINHVAFVLPAGTNLASTAQELLRAVDGGALEILDLEVLVRGSDGRVVRAEVRDHPGLEAFEGATTNLLDDEDLGLIAAEVAEGEVVLVVVYEERTLAATAAQVFAAGGRELWSGGVSIADLEEALSAQPEEEL